MSFTGLRRKQGPVRKMFFRPVVFAYYGSHYERRLRCQHGLPSFGHRAAHGTLRCERPHRRSQCRKLARDESLSSNGRPRPAPQLKAGNPILASRKDRVVAPGQFLCCARACSLQEARAEWRRSIQRCSDNLCQAQARAGRFPGPGI